MTISFDLQKGMTFDLSKTISKIHVGLGWKPSKSGADADLDAIAILLNDKQLIDKRENVIFYGNKVLKQKDGSFLSTDGAVHHLGDNLVGGNSDDDEVIEIDFEKLDPTVKSIVFAVAIFDSEKRKQHFGMIENSRIRIMDLSNDTELCKYDLTNQYAGFDGVQIGMLNKAVDDSWSFEAIGNGYNGNLNELFSFYS